MPYKYIKAPPGYTLVRPEPFSTHLRRGISAILLTFGIAASTSVAYPLITYQLSYAPRFEPKLDSSNIALPSDPIPTVSAAEPTFLPEMINTSLDYTDSSTWFPQSETSSPVISTSYTLSIPTLGIDNALVQTGSQDLKNSLIQYPGTAFPGDLGNSVIFGHSVLPQFFNPHNYTTIFSTLHTLTKGEDIIVTHDGATYTYRIYDMYEVMPDNLSPLAQTYDDRYLTLITCTPPGTYLRRLIIRARLMPI